MEIDEEIRPEIRSRWYDALSREDSMGVMELLAEDPRLLRVGWGRGKQASEIKSKEELWKQRTALHVGVRRGNAKLVEQVLILCKVAKIVRWKKKRVQSSDEETAGRPQVEDVDQMHAGETSTKTRAGASHATEVEVAQTTDEETASGALAEDVDQKQVGETSPTRNSEGQPHSVETEAAQTSAEKTASGASVEDVDVKEVGEISSAENSGGEPQSAEFEAAQTSDEETSDEEDLSSRILDEDVDEKQAQWTTSALIFVQKSPKGKDDVFLRDFLLARDEEYDLDAIAIGAIHGNRSIFHLLLRAIGECKLYGEEWILNRPLDVIHDTEEIEETQCRDQRAKLREATEKHVLSDRSRISGLLAYQRDLDFNFLPWKQYLFHFYAAKDGSDIDSFRKLWMAIRSTPAWRFLLNLRDGQGRTPCHLLSSAWRIFFLAYPPVNNPLAEEADSILGLGLRHDHLKFIMGETKFEGLKLDSEVVECLLGARDGADRTAFHRALATGDYDVLEILLHLSAFPSVQGGDMRHSLLLRKARNHCPGDWLVSNPEVIVKLLNFVSAGQGFAKTFSRWYTEYYLDSHLRTALSHTLAGRTLSWATKSLLWRRTKAASSLPSVTSNEPESPSQLAALWKSLHEKAGAFLQAAHCCLRGSTQEESWPPAWEPWRFDAMCRYRWDETGSTVGLQSSQDHSLPQRKDESAASHSNEKQWWFIEDKPDLWGNIERLQVDESEIDAFVKGERARPVRFRYYWEEADVNVLLHPVEWAALVGDVENLESLPLEAYYANSKLISSRSKRRCPWPAIHIAANAGNYEMLKFFVAEHHCDPYARDWNGNTALHHALNVVTVGECRHLLDYVDCAHVKANDPRKASKKSSDDVLAVRKGCILLLLQAGCDVFKTNDDGQPPYPKGKLSENSQFLSWWYEVQAKEFEATQRTLSSAANAISVVATLVATASYVGPLQPPLGYDGDISQIQDANVWVRMFFFCDTMSFYLAIVAITLSLLPNLPMPQQQMADEVRRTRRMVALSVAVLFPSVIFVLLAFISSSIAVVSANVTSVGGSIAISTASIGGFLCFATFIVFSARLLAFIFPRNKLIRKIYNATNL